MGPTAVGGAGAPPDPSLAPPQTKTLNRPHDKKYLKLVFPVVK